MNKKCLGIMVIVCVLFWWGFFGKYFSGKVAGSTDNIGAVVTLGYCGDGVVGDGEECDGSNLNGKGCGDMSGYNHGTLMCDNSCDFDVRSCSQVTPTGVPTNVPTNVPTTAISSLVRRWFPTTVPAKKEVLDGYESETMESPTNTMEINPTTVKEREVKAVEAEEEKAFFEKTVVKKASVITAIGAFVGGAVQMILKIVRLKKVPAFILGILKWFRF